MRIAIVNHYARVVGGADRHCLTLAEGLRNRGHSVAFLSTTHPDNLERSGVFIPLSVSRESKRGASVREQLGIAARAFWNPDAAAGMTALIRDFRPQVVHAHKLYPQLSVAPLAVARRAGIPIVQTVHDYEPVAADWRDHTGGWIDGLEPRVRDRVLNTLLFPVKRTVHRRLVDRWVTVSRFVGEVLQLDGIDARVLRNSTDDVSGPFPPFGDRAGAVFAGTLSREKGLLDVLEVARSRPGLTVTIAGAGPLRETVERQAAEIPNLRFAGHLDRRALGELLRGSRVALMPSRWEDPGPLLTLEAMAEGTPVLAYPRGGLAEYVSDSGGGRVVPESPSDLARACDELTSDPGLWAELSANARRAVCGPHSPEEYLTAIEQVYGEAVERR